MVLSQRLRTLSTLFKLMKRTDPKCSPREIETTKATDAMTVIENDQGRKIGISRSPTGTEAIEKEVQTESEDETTENTATSMTTEMIEAIDMIVKEIDGIEITEIRTGTTGKGRGRGLMEGKTENKRDEFV